MKEYLPYKNYWPKSHFSIFVIKKGTFSVSKFWPQKEQFSKRFGRKGGENVEEIAVNNRQCKWALRNFVFQNFSDKLGSWRGTLGLRTCNNVTQLQGYHLLRIPPHAAAAGPITKKVLWKGPMFFLVKNLILTYQNHLCRRNLFHFLETNIRTTGCFIAS